MTSVRIIHTTTVWCFTRVRIASLTFIRTRVLFCLIFTRVLPFPIILLSIPTAAAFSAVIRGITRTCTSTIVSPILLCKPGIHFGIRDSFQIKSIKSKSVNKSGTQQKGYHHSTDYVRLIQNFFQEHYILLIFLCRVGI